MNIGRAEERAYLKIQEELGRGSSSPSDIIDVGLRNFIEALIEESDDFGPGDEPYLDCIQNKCSGCFHYAGNRQELWWYDGWYMHICDQFEDILPCAYAINPPFYYKGRERRKMECEFLHLPVARSQPWDRPDPDWDKKYLAQYKIDIEKGMREEGRSEKAIKAVLDDLKRFE